MAASLRASAESSLPPTPSTLASLRISTDTWSQLPDSPARLPTAAVGGGSGQWTSQQLLAAELEARNQALRRILAPGGGRESTNQDVARSQHPSAAPAAPVSRAVDHVFEMMEAKKLRTVDLFRDRDGGGAVDAAELRADFDRHGVRLSHEDAKGLFGALDQDGNGEVDKREFVEQMRLLKNARRGAAASPRLEPEPEPEPEPQQIPRQQRARTARAPKVRPRPLSPRTAAASASRLSRTGAAAAPAAARTRPAASSAGGGLPPWLPGGTSVRSSASSARSGVESASLSAQAARGSRGPGGSSSRANAAAGRAGGARPSRGGGRSSRARRPRPAWASPPPTPTAAAADSEGGTGEHAVGAVVLQAMEDRNLRALDLFHALDRDSSGTIDQDELQGALLSTLGLELGVNELQELLTTLDKDGDGKIQIREFVQEIRHAKNLRAGREIPTGERHALGPTRGRQQLAQIAIGTSTQATDIESQSVQQSAAASLSLREQQGEPRPEDEVVQSAQYASEDRAVRLPRALQQLQQDMEDLSTAGRDLRRQLRRAVHDYAAVSETTVFDLRCNREHQGYPALMVQSKCDVLRQQHIAL